MKLNRLIQIIKMNAVTQSIKTAIDHAITLAEQKSYDQAWQQTQEILSLYPNEVNALRVQGLILKKQRKLEQALTVLRKAVKIAPEFALLHQEMGECFFISGDFNNAIMVLQRALQLEPSLGVCWQLIGECYIAQQNEVAAEHAFRQHLKHSNRDRDLLMAIEAMNRSQISVAEQHIRSYLKREPTDVTAIRLLADIGLRLKRYRDAQLLLERCLELAPDYYLARLNYAAVLNYRQQSAAALEQIKLLERGFEEKPATAILKASVLATLGRFEEAVSLYRDILSRNKPQAKIAMSLGHALKTLGKRDESIAAYEQAIELEPTLGEAYWSLANLKTYRFSEATLADMQRILDTTKLVRSDYFHLCFALGKGYEDSKAYDLSFKYYELGNAAKKTIEPYRPDINARVKDRTIATCTAQLLKDAKTQGAQQGDPIFIVGLPRSGSTLLEQIIASHSQVDGTKELADIIAIARRLGRPEKVGDPLLYPDILATLSAQDKAKLGEEYLKRASVQRGNAPMFIDKMPNNFAHIGLIKSILPNAKIIDARRHPMAACFGGFKQLFASGQRFSYSLTDIGQYYADYVDLMNHWDKVLPGEVLRVNYEQVVANTESEIRRILDFLELPFEEACLNFHASDRAVRTASSEQVRQPIYTSALALWANYDAHLQPLSQALGDCVTNYENEVPEASVKR